MMLERGKMERLVDGFEESKEDGWRDDRDGFGVQ